MVDDNYDPDRLMTERPTGTPMMTIRPQNPDAGVAVSPAMHDVLYNVIAPGESGGRPNILYGGKEFSDLSQHPNVHVPITTGPNAGLYSTAAGTFQFIKPTWDMAAKATGRSDFSKESQEINAAWLAAKTYKDSTGRDIETDYASGDPKLRAGIKQALASQWESLGKPGPRVDKLWTLGNDKFRFSDEALTAHDGADDTSMVYMHPEHYLALSPSMDDDPSHSVSGGQALRSSLAKGEAVNNVPHLTLDENGQVVIQDGRSRALMANMAGVDLIPTAIKNITQLPEHLTGASGNQVQTAGMIPKDQIATEKSGGSIVGRMLGISPAQAEEAPKDDGWTPVTQPEASEDGWTPVASDHKMGFFERLGSGMLDPLIGAEQLVSHLIPGSISETIDQKVHAREAAIQAETPNPDRVETQLDPQGRASHVNVGPSPGQDPARMIGNVLSPINLAAPTRALGAGGLVREVGNAAIQGATIGGLEPVTGEGSFTGQKAAQVGMGALAGGVIPPGVAAAKAIGNWAVATKGAEALEDKAVQDILKRIQASQRGGGPTFQDMLDLINTAPGKPWVLADMPAANLKALVGKVARSPGEAKQIMQTALMARDLDAATRIEGDVIGEFGGESAYYADKALGHARSIQSRPLFDEAAAGGSLAPLRQQFETANAAAGRAEFEAAREVAHAETRITEAARREQQAGDNVYGVNGAREDRRAAEVQRDFAQQELARTRAEKESIADTIRQAQEDMASGKKGAVWSPKLDRLLKNPNVKQGISKGWAEERNLADAAGRPLNTTEYAITGTDAAGDPIVSKVPTMRLLMVAKEGLDAMVEAHTDKITGEIDKEGYTLMKLRNSLTEELDDLNPDYKKARGMWGGHSEARTATRSGQNFNKMNPEAIESMMHGDSPAALRTALEKVKDPETGAGLPQDVIEQAVLRAHKGMSQNEKEFFRLGAANTIRKMLSVGERSDETRKLMLPEAKKQLRALFDSDADFDKFFRSLNAEHMMFDTWAKTYGGSPTAERLADDATAHWGGIAHAFKAAMDAVRFNPMAAYHAERAWEKLGPKEDPAKIAAQARMLTSPASGAVTRLQAAEKAAPTSNRRLTPFLVPPMVYETEPKHAVGATNGMPAP